MSWSDQDIDKLFQQAGQPDAPPFQEAFWKEMEAMLPQQKRRKAALVWWAGGAAVVALLLSSLLFLQTGTEQGINLTVRKAPASEETTTGVLAAEHPATTNRSISESPATAQHSTSGKTHRAGLTSGEQVVPADRTPFATQLPPLAKTHAVAQPVPTNPEMPTHLPAKHFYRNLPLIVPRDLVELQEESSKFYVQASTGIGMSARKLVPGGTNTLHCYAIGGGLYKRIDHVILTLGIQGRVDFVNNIRYTYFPDGTIAKQIDANYRQLYSIEMPASIGLQKGKNQFSLNMNAGFQAGVFGELKETENQVVVRSENTFVRVDDKAKTLTMEIGCSYLRQLSTDWSLGVGLNADIIGPFNGSSYAGRERLLPLNGQLLLRRTF